MNNSLARWETYNPVALGLEDMFKRLDVLTDSAATNYPPYNIIKVDDVTSQLEIALAGVHQRRNRGGSREECSYSQDQQVNH